MTIINKTGTRIPHYLDRNFFIDALEDGFREIGILLNQITFEMGSNVGDNCCSSIYRVKLNFIRISRSYSEDVSIIVKTIPVTSSTQFLDDAGVFMKEKTMYCDVLPRLEILLDGVKLGAKYLYAIKKPVQTIVFDDLKADGFTTASRQDMLDFDHSKVLLEKLGQLHGSSMVLAKKDPSITSKFEDGMLCKVTLQLTETFDKMFGNNLDQLATLVSEWPGYEEIAAKLKKYRANFKAKTVAIGQPRYGEISVLNHGDLWTSNFMFSYDRGRPVDGVFVDFQMSYFCSPACDINFFLSTSVQYDTLVHQRDALIDAYYESFSKTLESLNYVHVPTIDDLRSELREREAYGLFGLFGFLPMVTLDQEKSEETSIDSLSSEEGRRKQLEEIFSNEKLHKYFEYNLKRFDELGVLDEVAS